MVSTENIYYDIINHEAFNCILHAFERKIQNIPTPKNYSARPGNTLLGITDAKEEILCRIKNIFKLRILANVLNKPQIFRTECCMYATALIFN